MKNFMRIYNFISANNIIAAGNFQECLVAEVIKELKFYSKTIPLQPKYYTNIIKKNGKHNIRR